MKKLAMIGCGNIGRYHLNHFLKYDDVELAGFCDLIPERAQAFADEAHSRAFRCYREMYDAVKPDMVFICVPPTEHGEIELETIRRGIHLFVEKPVALDAALAKHLRDEILKSGLISASGFQLRYETAMDPLKAFAADYPIVRVDTARMGGVPDAPWWKVRATSGGQIVEQTIHQFDMIRSIMGEPDTVFTMGRRGIVQDVEGFDTEDLSATVVRFRSGALATITTGCYARTGAAADNKTTFGAVNARADYYMFDKVMLYGVQPPAEHANLLNEVVKGDGRLLQQNEALEYKTTGDCGTLCDRTFVDAVITGDGSKIRSPYADAVNSVLFTLACNQSMDTGLPVKVNLD